MPRNMIRVNLLTTTGLLAIGAVLTVLSVTPVTERTGYDPLAGTSSLLALVAGVLAIVGIVSAKRKGEPVAGFVVLLLLAIVFATQFFWMFFLGFALGGAG